MIASRVYIFSAFLLVLCSFQAVFSDPVYEPTWDSLNSRPLPQWYDDAKVGILIHWGVYSVPSYGNEKFWYNWKESATTGYVNFMRNYYSPGFTYQEFAKDFRAELFNPNQWAQLIRDSGAKYVVLTSKHQDGYTLWPSSYSFSWNSMDIGPRKDIIWELFESLRRLQIKFGLYYSLSEWYNKLFIEDRFTGFKEQKYVVNKIQPELVELVNYYRPNILWSDGGLEASSEYWNSTKFLAWLYNKSPASYQIVTNDRWGKDTRCKHGGFLTCSDRFNPGVLQKRKWENAFSLDKSSWGHRFDATVKDFMTSEEIIKEIVTTVSCGGNALINVGPTRHGTIQPIFEERLLDMGKWLKMNDEAIYGSQPWIVQKDPRTEGVWYTKKDDGERIYVYAIVLKYPFDTNAVDFYALVDQVDKYTVVELLGWPGSIEWTKTNSSVHVQFPKKNIIDKLGYKHAWTFRIRLPKN